MRTTPHPAYLEQLEARVVLSGTYYEWVGVDTLPGYQAEFGEADEIVGASGNGRFLWSEAAADPEDYQVPFVIIDGQLSYVQDIPRLLDATVTDINSSGILLGIDRADADRIFTLDLLSDAARVYLDEMELNAPNGFDIHNVKPERISNSGSIVLSEADVRITEQDVWIVRGSEVTFLWEGAIADINSSDAVIGWRDVSEYFPETLLWTPEDGIRILGEQQIYDVSRIADDGTVYGKQEHDLVLWRDGEIEILPYSDTMGPGDDSADVYPGGMDDGGRLMVNTQYFSGQSSGGFDRVVEDGSTVNFAVRNDIGLNDVRLLDAGYIVLPVDEEQYDAAAGWYQPVEADPEFFIEPESDVISWVENGLITTLVHQQTGEWVEFVQADDGSVTVQPSNVTGAGGGTWEVITSPTTGRVLVVRTADGAFSWLDPGEANVPQSFVAAEGNITQSVAGFFDRRDNPVVVGLDDDGTLLMAWGAPQGDSFRPVLTDLSAEHLGARGLATPEFVGELDAYRTAWGGMHIVGLDNNGDVQAVWWGPFTRERLWNTTNLSELTGAPRLVGTLQAMTSPWGGIQIMGAADDGTLIAMWWGPQSGGWQYISLTERMYEFRETSISSVLALEVSQEGHISMMAVSADGDVLVGLWENRRGWRGVNLTKDESTYSSPLGWHAPEFVGTPSHVLLRNGDSHILVAAEAGHLVDASRLGESLSNQRWDWVSLSVQATT